MKRPSGSLIQRCMGMAGIGDRGSGIRKNPEHCAVSLTNSGSRFPGSLPAARLALVLLLQPRVQRREVVDDRARVHFLLAGKLLQRLLPRLLRALRKHLPVLRTGFLVAVDRTL